MTSRSLAGKAIYFIMTHRSSRRRPQYADLSQQLDEDLNLHRWPICSTSPRGRGRRLLWFKQDPNQASGRELPGGVFHRLGRVGHMTQKRHEALQAEEQNLIQHRTVAQSHQDWVEDLTEILT